MINKIMALALISPLIVSELTIRMSMMMFFLLEKVAEIGTGAIKKVSDEGGLVVNMLIFGMACLIGIIIIVVRYFRKQLNKCEENGKALIQENKVIQKEYMDDLKRKNAILESRLHRGN